MSGRYANDIKCRVHHSHSWCDGMECHCLQYRVTPNIDPWFHDSPVVCPWHPASTCVATHVMAPKSHFSKRQCSASHDKDVTRLSPHCYYLFLACRSPYLSPHNRAFLTSFETASWVSHEFERTRGKVTENVERNVSRHHTELECLSARLYPIVHLRWRGFNMVLNIPFFFLFSEVNDSFSLIF
ncbi:transposable element Tcb1 transposase [Trichonephila clavipes]|nr:transposable element Tcb1 transposase [Trichonephila clavipes]